MPIDAVDSRGNIQRLILRNVRCVPTFRDSLLSVSQLWESTSTECRFGGTRAMFLHPAYTESASRYLLVASAVCMSGVFF
eukprot:6202655-Pleurochrysis_carterae.AAC.1